MANTLPVSAGGAWLDAIPRSLLCDLYCDFCRLVPCNRAKAQRIATRLNTITAAALRMCCRRPGFHDFPSAGRKNAIGVEIEGAPVDIVHGCVVAHHGFTRCFARLTDRRVGVPLPACVSSTQGTTAHPRTEAHVERQRSMRAAKSSGSTGLAMTSVAPSCLAILRKSVLPMRPPPETAITFASGRSRRI